MSRLPNVPATAAGDTATGSAQPASAGLHVISAGPAPVAASPAPSIHSAQPAQIPLTNPGAQGEQGFFVTDDQFIHDFLKENYTVPITVLIVSAVLGLAFNAYQGYAASDIGMGFVGAVGGCIVMCVMLVIASLTSTAAGWIVCKIFGEDYGSLGGLLLRFSAVAAAQMPVFAVINALVGGLLSLFFFVPAMLVVAIWVAGLDIIRAIVFIAILTVINWMLIAFTLASFATALM
jgi:hypothetical protein